ncbi:putative trabsposase [Gluconacetobacter diazotrophicus PA1 5]|uniref:Putative trabsposase n=1 Tax=Gluconacetobacter diazotrophicus (strain ATCC 49037 / DSM 5601 / CCUG 37298 / CIP 103539 / LMG 7603 / PAl5) TaxID=272568 RepID=A9HQ58_GLUDA|nr:putative trabsposase [Gluconacetobacter diazotrophicus PA1 5]
MTTPPRRPCSSPRSWQRHRQPGPFRRCRPPHFRHRPLPPLQRCKPSWQHPRRLPLRVRRLPSRQVRQPRPTPGQRGQPRQRLPSHRPPFQSRPPPRRQAAAHRKSARWRHCRHTWRAQSSRGRRAPPRAPGRSLAGYRRKTW